MANRMSMRVSTGESGLRILPEAFRSRVSQLAEETVDSLLRIWTEAGYEEVECQRLLGDLLSKMKITCANELAAEQQILEHAKQEVAANVSELTKMNEQLGRKTQIDHIAKMNYTDKLAELERMLNSVGEVYAQRQGLIDDEMANIRDLVEELGESMPNENLFQGPPGTPYLSDIRLNLMKDCTRDFQELRSQRIQEMRNVAQECLQHMQDMMYIEEGYTTMNDSEKYANLDKQIVRFAQSGDLSTLITAHKKDQALLTHRLQLFIEEKERRRQHLAQTGDEIAKLWSLLRIPSIEREAFQSSFKHNLSMDTLSKGDDEVKRLQEIRRKSLGRVILCIRSDILTLWEEAGIESDEQRHREFPLYFQEVDSLDDSAVDLHESYFTQLRQRVEELKPILNKISKREVVVNERIELEHLQLNPERLTARGPNAREERKREEAMTNRVKNLDKLTKEIVAAVQVWEESNGPFLYGGERYLDRIPRQDEHFIETRDALRNARKRKDGKDVPSTANGTMRGSVAAMPTTKKPLATLNSSSGASTPFSTPHSVKKANILGTADKAPYSSLPLPPPLTVVMDENRPPFALNRDSDGTIGTTMTELKERNSSTGSATVVHEAL
eukprot:gene10648-11806_t